jgi:SprT protein
MRVGHVFPDTLQRHLPPGAEAYVGALLAVRNVAVRVSRPRLTKLGDHRPPRPGDHCHRISVNENLNPYAFLTTLLHEIAHADVWMKHVGHRRRRIKPHGPEWKGEFAALLVPVVAAPWLPDDVSAALAATMHNPAAMSCSDRRLVLALARHDTPSAARMRVEDVPLGGVFRVDNGRVFCRGRRVRTRYLCVEHGTGAEYRVHALAFAEIVAMPALNADRPAEPGPRRGSAVGGRCFRRRGAAGRDASRSACP